MLSPTVRNLIEDVVFGLFQKLAAWLDAKIPSVAVRLVLGLLLSITAIASVVTLTALARF
jgi:hypothetical protein